MSLPVIKVFQLEPPHPHAGKWTFTIDGQESLYYCPHQAAAERVVKRLQDPGQLRSRESVGVRNSVSAFLGQPVVAAEARVAMRQLANGKWTYTLDGKETGFEGTKAEVHCHADCCAFMTRGKLGRLKEAEEQFRAEHGCNCSVKVTNGKLVVESEDGHKCCCDVPARGPISFKSTKE